MLGSKKATIGIDIQKNVIRYCALHKRQIVCGEKIVQENILKNNKIRNQEELRDILREIFSELSLKNPSVIIPVLNSKVLIRQIPLQDMSTEKEIREFLFFELGESIPLPFENPVFDLLILDPPKKRKSEKKLRRKNMGEEKDHKGNVKSELKTIKRNRFAINGKVPVCITSEELLEEFGETIQQSKGHLSGVDFSALAYTSVLKREIEWGKSFALIEIDSGEATITIFEKLVPVYVHYEEYNRMNWRYKEHNGQIFPEYKEELEALSQLGIIIKNVVHHFESEISNDGVIGNIYLVGGHPRLKQEVVDAIREHNAIPVTPVTSSFEKIKVPDRFLLALGLALKEV